MHRSQRHLRRPHQVEVVVGAVDLFTVAGEEPGAEQGVLAYQHRGDDGDEAVRLEPVDRPADQSQLERHQRAGDVAEPASGHLGGPLDVDQPEGFAELEVVASGPPRCVARPRCAARRRRPRRTRRRRWGRPGWAAEPTPRRSGRRGPSASDRAAWYAVASSAARSSAAWRSAPWPVAIVFPSSFCSARSSSAAVRCRRRSRSTAPNAVQVDAHPAAAHRVGDQVGSGCGVRRRRSSCQRLLHRLLLLRGQLLDARVPGPPAWRRTASRCGPPGRRSPGRCPSWSTIAMDRESCPAMLPKAS